MLRTTVSRFKVCSGAFTPRILKGDAYGGPVACSVVRKSYKSTKSTDDGKKDTDASEEDYDKKKYKGTASVDEKSTQYFRTEEPSIPLTHREKCQRIIDKAFGACEHTAHDREVTQTYFSHNVNLEDTRREIIESERAKSELNEPVKIKNPIPPESRTQYNCFKMTGELIKDEDHDEIALSKDSMSKVPPTAKGHRLTDQEDPVKTLNIHMTKTEEPNVTKNSDGVETGEENAPLLESYSINAKEDVGKFMHNPESVENKTLRDDDAETIELVKDERKQYMFEKAIPQEQVHTLLPYNRTQFDAYSLLREDEKQDEFILMDSMMKLSPVACSQFTTTGREDLETKVKNVEESVKKRVENTILRGDNFNRMKMDYDEKKHMFINATTAKEEEEKLTQKLEIIEETPLVEAHIPKVEGFNVTPRVLGDHQPILNSKSIENDEDYIPRKPALPVGNIDDVAKRCLKCPLGRIDEILINEMEKSPLTSKTESYASKALLGDMVVKVDKLKRQPNRNMEGQEIHSRKLEANDEEPYVEGLKRPPPLVTIDTRLPDLNGESEERTLIHPKEDNQPKEATEQAMEKTFPLKTLKPHLVTERRVLGIDSTEDAERATSIANTKATLSEELDEHELCKDKQNTQCTKGPAETESIYSKATSLDSQKDALQKYMTQFKGVYNPSYCGTVNSSNNASDELQSKETDRRSFYERNLSTSYLWGKTKKDASDSKRRYVQHEVVTDPNERGQTPQVLKVERERVEHDETTANSGLKTVPYGNFHMPGNKWENNVNYLPKMDKVTPIDSHKKSYLTKEELRPGQECVKQVSLTEEILTEHELDPYYVLTCNETCPIAPLSTMSTCNCADFVDTTETIYMKKNVCESVRPKPLPGDVLACEKIPSETKTLHELDIELEPEVIPEGTYIALQQPKPANTTDEQKKNIPKLCEQVSLTELLRRVRQRSRLECLTTLKSLRIKTEPSVGKCSRKDPRCAPMAPRSPPNNPVSTTTFDLPMLERRPRICKPPKKTGGCKCTACDVDVLCGVQIGEICPVMTYELNEAELNALRSKTDLTEVILDHLHNLGKAVSGVLRQAKSTTETLFARDYYPWTPIPSWPSPKKGKKKWQPATPCNYKCPDFPKARASINPDPPCVTKPCQGFPKRRSFSILDYFAVTLGDVESEVK